MLPLRLNTPFRRVVGVVARTISYFFREFWGGLLVPCGFFCPFTLLALGKIPSENEKYRTQRGLWRSLFFFSTTPHVGIMVLRASCVFSFFLFYQGSGRLGVRVHLGYFSHPLTCHPA